MQIEQRKVATQSGRNVTVTFYMYGPQRGSALSNMLYRVETHGQLPMFIYKVRGTKKVRAVLPGITERMFKNAKAAFCALSRTHWNLGA